MDILIRFIDPSTTPADYVISELDMIDVTWDDVSPGFPYIVEGAESIVMRIVTLARDAENLESVIVL